MSEVNFDVFLLVLMFSVLKIAMENEKILESKDRKITISREIVCKMMALFGITTKLDVTAFLNSTNLELCENISDSTNHITIDLKSSHNTIKSFVKAAIVRNGLKM